MTKEMREFATKRFVTLRRNIYIEEVQSAPTDPFFVLPQVLPDELISQIIDALFQLDFNALDTLVSNEKITKPHVMRIWTVVIEMRESFRGQLKREAAKKTAPKMCVSSSA